MKKTIIFFVFILLNMNSWSQDHRSFQVADRYHTSKFDVAIFPETSLDMILGMRFTPTREDIEKAETALKTQLQELNKPLVNQHNSPIIHKKLRKYKRQYFGYINDKGQKILLINSFWNKKEYSYWLESKVSVLDGGSYYWSVNYDLETNELFDLYINGSA